MNKDEIYMKRCFDLALAGRMSVSPNPRVGSVIVHKDKIIGEGYHRKYGEAHAEVNAVASVSNHDLLEESTIYVNLEPCSHYGKTPPCADLIIKHRFKRVVVCNLDPNPLVSGNGIKKIREAGIEVEQGILEEEGLKLNRRFFTQQVKNRPYIIFKWAESKDGFIDIDRKNDEKGVFWISQPETQSLSHQWRAEEDAILVGRKTVETDDPSLNCRSFNGKDPLRIVLDPSDTLKGKDFKVLKDEGSTLIFNRERKEISGNKEWIQYEGDIILAVIEELNQRNIQSLIIEGGKKTLDAFIEKELWDEARVIRGKNELKNGISAPQLSMEVDHIEEFHGDQIHYYIS